MANTTAKRTPRNKTAAAETEQQPEITTVVSEDENIVVGDPKPEQPIVEEPTVAPEPETKTIEETPKVEKDSYKEIVDLGNGAFAFKLRGRFVVKGVWYEKAKLYYDRY